MPTIPDYCACGCGLPVDQDPGVGKGAAVRYFANEQCALLWRMRKDGHRDSVARIEASRAGRVERAAELREERSVRMKALRAEGKVKTVPPPRVRPVPRVKEPGRPVATPTTDWPDGLARGATGIYLGGAARIALAPGTRVLILSRLASVRRYLVRPEGVTSGKINVAAAYIGPSPS